MAEDRITERIDAEGNVTERIFEREAPASVGGGGSGLFIGLVLLILAAIIAFFLFSLSTEETRQTDAISEAATSVGEGAKKAGEGMEKLGNAAEKAADRLVE